MNINEHDKKEIKGCMKLIKKSEEETKLTMKIPLFEEGEIEKIDRFTSEIAREINEKVLKEKDMIIAQRLIHNLQQRIDKAIEYIEDRFTLDKKTGGYHLTHTFDCDNICELYLILKGSDNNE